MYSSFNNVIYANAALKNGPCQMTWTGFLGSMPGLIKSNNYQYHLKHISDIILIYILTMFFVVNVIKGCDE